MIGARLRPRTGRRRVDVITSVVSVALLSGAGTGLRRTGRWTGPRDWTVWPNLAVLELTTPTGAVELGIHDEHVAWLLAQLGLAEDVSDGGARVRP